MDLYWTQFQPSIALQLQCIVHPYTCTLVQYVRSTHDALSAQLYMNLTLTELFLADSLMMKTIGMKGSQLRASIGHNCTVHVLRLYTIEAIVKYLFI